MGHVDGNTISDCRFRLTALLRFYFRFERISPKGRNKILGAVP